MSQNQDTETRKERRARERREQKQGRSHPAPHRASKVSRNSKQLISWLLLAFILGGATSTLLLKLNTKSDEVAHTSSPSNAYSLNGKDFSFVLSLTPEQVADYDMAELNLLCGTGLNGNEKVNLSQCRKDLDDLTKMVRAETERNWQRFLRNPSEYQNSEAYYRMGMLITVIRQDFKAKYNPKVITDPSKRTENEVFFKDASNVFLQGLLTGDKMGTCASMPVLYVAVGRRLGYPVYLVSTKGHQPPFPRFRSGQSLFQRPSPQKQIPSNKRRGGIGVIWGWRWRGNPGRLKTLRHKTQERGFMR